MTSLDATLEMEGPAKLTIDRCSHEEFQELIRCTSKYDGAIRMSVSSIYGDPPVYDEVTLDILHNAGKVNYIELFKDLIGIISSGVPKSKKV